MDWDTRDGNLRLPEEKKTKPPSSASKQELLKSWDPDLKGNASEEGEIMPGFVLSEPETPSLWKFGIRNLEESEPKEEEIVPELVLSGPESPTCLDLESFDFEGFAGSFGGRTPEVITCELQSPSSLNSAGFDFDGTPKEVDQVPELVSSELTFDFGDVQEQTIETRVIVSTPKSPTLVISFGPEHERRRERVEQIPELVSCQPKCPTLFCRQLRKFVKRNRSICGRFYQAKLHHLGLVEFEIESLSHRIPELINSEPKSPTMFWHRLRKFVRRNRSISGHYFRAIAHDLDVLEIELESLPQKEKQIPELGISEPQDPSSLEIPVVISEQKPPALLSTRCNDLETMPKQTEGAPAIVSKPGSTDVADFGHVNRDSTPNAEIHSPTASLREESTSAPPLSNFQTSTDSAPKLKTHTRLNEQDGIITSKDSNFEGNPKEVFVSASTPSFKGLAKGSHIRFNEPDNSRTEERVLKSPPAPQSLQSAPKDCKPGSMKKISYLPATSQGQRVTPRRS